MIRQVIGVANYPEFEKFRVFLSCGHSILCDHSVDRVRRFLPNGGDKVSLACMICEKEQYK